METREINRLLQENTPRFLNFYLWAQRIIDCSIVFYFLSVFPYLMGATHLGMACTATGAVCTLLALVPTYLRLRLARRMQPIFEMHPNPAERDRIVRDAVREYRRKNP